jgi:hypothetical protein
LRINELKESLSYSRRLNAPVNEGLANTAAVAAASTTTAAAAAVTTAVAATPLANNLQANASISISNEAAIDELGGIAENSELDENEFEDEDDADEENGDMAGAGGDNNGVGAADDDYDENEGEIPAEGKINYNPQYYKV